MVVIVYNKMRESIKMEQFKRMTEDDLSVVSGGSKLQCAVTQAGGALADLWKNT
ncbi:bacteriocin-type signal sequence-containing protein [Streptococcus equinus]|nr:bacteriocin-type signal sequence-containing protein [Streptococcus equinus]